MGIGSRSPLLFFSHRTLPRGLTRTMTSATACAVGVMRAVSTPWQHCAPVFLLTFFMELMAGGEPRKCYEHRVGPVQLGLDVIRSVFFSCGPWG